MAVCAERAAQAYCDRWQIETSFFVMKQEFALEKARVRTFKKKVQGAFWTDRKYFSPNVFGGLVKIRDKLSRRNRDKGAAGSRLRQPFFYDIILRQND